MKKNEKKTVLQGNIFTPKVINKEYGKYIK
jgi:hypothetical protein